MEAGTQVSLLTILVAVWGAITVALICLVIYRSTLESREDDQIFLDAAEQTMANEQQQIIAKIGQISRPITVLMVLSGVLLLGIAGIWLWQGFSNF